MASKFKTVWFKNPEDREAIENALLHSPALKRLREILSSRMMELDSKELSLDTYKELSWSHVQAHLNGQKQELIYLLTLLDQGERID